MLSLSNHEAYPACAGFTPQMLARRMPGAFFNSLLTPLCGIRKSTKLFPLKSVVNNFLLTPLCGIRKSTKLFPLKSVVNNFLIF